MERAPEHSRRGVRGPRRAVAAPRCARLVSAAVHGSDGERCIHPDWSSDAHRSGRQEFNSNRRVRQRRVRTRRPLVEAALDGARLRFRPLMMTALAFIVGCVPLWTASGAGAIARQIIGTTVIGGMLAETFIGRFFVPAIFYVVEKFSGAEKRKALPLAPAEAPNLGD